MRPAGDGGGGSTVLIDPTTLQRSAGRLKTTAQELQVAKSALGQISTPDMPAEVTSVVASALAETGVALGPMPTQLDQFVVELTRRAFWAEYADQLAAGYDLSGKALDEFKAWMKDGTLLEYATSDEAVSAGRELAVAYSGFRKDPQQLIDLALSLKASENDGASQDVQRAFAGGFVECFGAKNMATVPRMIQAMEWSRAIAFETGITNPHVMHDVALNWAEDDKTLQQDPVNDLLAPFCMALANATYSQVLSQNTSSAIADDDDTWATAQLLARGKFNTPFLVQCFQSGVVNKIVDDSRSRLVPGGVMPETEFDLGQMWSQGKNGLPHDTKQIVLDAIARNPQAAAQVLNQSIDAQPFDQFGQREHVTNPVALLYQYGQFDDHGTAFSNVYTAGDDWAYDHDRQAAGSITLSVADQLLNHNRGDSMAPVTDALARGLADHYMHDLHLAAEGGTGDVHYDPDHDGIVGAASDKGIDLSRAQTQNLIGTMLGDDNARQHLLHGVSAFQANEIRAGVAGHSDLGEHWGHALGSFDGVLNSANEADNVHDVQDAQARQQAISGALNDVMSLVPLPPEVNIVASHVPDLIASHWGPHGLSATDSSAAFHDSIEDQLNASITSGYLSAHPDVAATIPHQLTAIDKVVPFKAENFLDSSGHMIPWSSMNSDQQRTFIAWYDHSDAIQHLADGSRQDAQNGFLAHDEDQTGN